MSGQRLTREQERMVAEVDGAVPRFTTKDSGKREEYASGMVRDTQEGKARFDLLIPKGVPYREQMLTRFAELMARGADKYGDRNWELAEGEAELERYRSSALRHLMQWATGETDEDHAAAVMFNVMAGETVRFKMDDAEEPTRPTASNPLGMPCDYMTPRGDPCRRAYGHDGVHWGTNDPEMC